MERGQAAVEYLVTFGWAFLIVLVSVGVLAYFGILNPARFLPSTYLLEGGLGAGEHKIDTAGTVTLGIINSMRMRINVTSVAISTTAGSMVACNDTNTTQGLLLPGHTRAWLLDCGPQFEGDRIKAEVRVTYIKENEAVEHTIPGTLKILVEE